MVAELETIKEIVVAGTEAKLDVLIILLMATIQRSVASQSMIRSRN